MRKVKIKFKPHDVQKQIIDLFYKPSTNFLTICCGRRLGKSYVSQYLMIKYGCENENKNILYVTPTYRLATLFFKQIIKRLKGTGIITDYSKGDLTIEFFNGTVIDFFSATQPDNLRGRKYNMGVLDEAAYYSDYAVKECILPCFATKTEGDPNKIVMISTPKGAVGSFYEFYHNNEEGFEHLSAPSTASPFVDEMFLSAMKGSLSRRAYQQEILAEFLKPGDGGIFKNVLSCINNAPETTETYFAGLDVGFQDSTVLTILNNKKQMVKQIEWEQIEFNLLIPLITAELSKYNIVKCYVEKNGIGKPVVDYLQSLNNNIEEWNTTNDSKNDIINSLMLHFEQNKINILDDKLLMNQLDCYEAQLTRTGKTTFNGVGQKDDRVMSLSIALRAAVDGLTTSEFSYVSIKRNKNKRR